MHVVWRTGRPSWLLPPEFVERRGWCSEEVFAELVAISQSLPGPASSQVAFALGWLRCGWVGGLSALVGFTFPSAALMVWFSFAEGALQGRFGAAILHGLQLAAVAVVAEAIFLMQKRLAPDWLRLAIAAVAAAIALSIRVSGRTPVAIAFGALCGWLFLHGGSFANVPRLSFGISQRAGKVALMIFLGLLMVSFAVQKVTAGVLSVAAAFYLSGSLVFGGGHVVLSLQVHPMFVVLFAVLASLLMLR